MKTLKDPKGLDLKPCLNCIPKVLQKINKKYPREDVFICPCPNHAGEIQSQVWDTHLGGSGKIILFNCENREMHRIPLKTPQRRSERRS